MNLRLALAVVGLLGAAGSPLSADDQSRAANTEVTQGAGPYARLFRAQDVTEQQQLRARIARELLRADPSRTEVICGLTVRYVDERNDPRIIVPRQDHQVDAKIRRIAPEICRKEAGDDKARTAR
jgi:hypothetical protein